MPLPAAAMPPPHHALIVRITHWVGAAAMICMILSGWAIYNASPLAPFQFPRWATLGGWLGGGIAWHLTAMWVLLADGAVYLAYGVLSGHFRRDFLPIQPRAAARETAAALAFRLGHDLSRYNSVQRLLYAAVLAASCLAVLTGLSIWKPVQFAPLTALFGGYPTARVLHFLAMSAIAAFLVVHVALVFAVPETFLAMITGRRAASHALPEHPLP